MRAPFALLQHHHRSVAERLVVVGRTTGPATGNRSPGSGRRRRQRSGDHRLRRFGRLLRRLVPPEGDGETRRGRGSPQVVVARTVDTGHRTFVGRYGGQHVRNSGHPRHLRSVQVVTQRTRQVRRAHD